jgi:hypothetical protein
MLTKKFTTLLFTAFLISCTSGPERITMEDKGSLNRGTSTLLSIIPTTILPTISYIPTLSSTIIQTRTFLPTLSKKLANDAFTHWLSGSSECLFPCWGEMIPGKTGWSDSINQVRTVLQPGDISHKASCRFGECDVIYWNYKLDGKAYDGLLFGKEETLYAIYISGDYYLAISLNNIFETYGQPSQILIQAIPNNAGDPPALYTIILYTHYKFIIKYLLPAKVEDGKIVTCETPEIIQLGIVAIDKNQWTQTEIAANGDQDTKSGTPILGARPISDVTNITIADFYSQVIQNPVRICISTPLVYWK